MKYVYFMSLSGSEQIWGFGSHAEDARSDAAPTVEYEFVHESQGTLFWPNEHFRTYCDGLCCPELHCPLQRNFHRIG